MPISQTREICKLTTKLTAIDVFMITTVINCYFSLVYHDSDKIFDRMQQAEDRV
jgi:hypothetical protein